MPAHGLLRNPTFVGLMTSAHRALRLKRVGLLKNLHAELQVVLKLLLLFPFVGSELVWKLRLVCMQKNARDNDLTVVPHFSVVFSLF